MRLLNKLSGIFDRTNDILTFLAVLFLAFITLLVTTEVVMRYFLGHSIIWVMEVSEYSLLWMTFLSTAWVLRREAHVKMDMVLNRLKPGTQSLLNILTSIIGAIVCFVIAWYSAGVTWDQFLRGVARVGMVDIPKAPVMAIIPIGSFLLFIQFLRRSYGYLRSWRAS